MARGYSFLTFFLTFVFQIPYDLRGRGVPTLQSQGNVLRVISPIFGQQDDGFAFVGSDFGDSSAGSRNVFGDNSFSSGASTQSDRSFQDIFGESRGQPGGTFPGTMFSPNFLGGQQGSFLGGRVSTGRVPSPAGVIQAQFGGDAGLGVNFAGLPSPPVFLQDQFRGDGSLGSSFPAGSVLQFGGDAGFGGGIAPGTAFQPLSPSFAGSSRVIEARPDVTLTRTITEDRFVTTTNVAFVKEPRTATIFSFVTQTAVTTVVSDTLLLL